MNETFINISKIIERDSKTTTYKFALLRGTIDIIQNNSPYIKISGDTVEIPLGLLIEKWLVYYYPILDSKKTIPQINGENTQIAFQNQFQKIISYYNKLNGLSHFSNDLRITGISKELKIDFYELIKTLKNTIVNKPMYHIGNSLYNNPKSIYKYLNNSSLRNSDIQNVQWLINSCGTFTIPIDYYEAFRILGSFISGTDNILFKWAEFSVKASGNELNNEFVLNEILKFPVDKRNVNDVQKIYRDILNHPAKRLYCVWSGLELTSIEEINVDHVIPFSIWKNNDLWNLLPAQSIINNKKRDKIPSKEILNKQKDLIVDYWETIQKAKQQRFLNEMQITLLGNNSIANWQNNAFNQLVNTSKYLIETRGYEEWKM